MKSIGNAVFEQALALPATERAELVDRLIESLDSVSDSEIDILWSVEVERRIEAYRKGELKSLPIEESFQQIDSRR
jgi:putative addiction module component (TIGR02574 family)